MADTHKIYLGPCRAADLEKHAAADALINANLGMAVLVSLITRRNVCGRQNLGVADLALSESQVRVAELVSSRCDMGVQSRLGGCFYRLHSARLAGLDLHCRRPNVGLRGRAHDGCFIHSRKMIRNQNRVAQACRSEQENKNGTSFECNRI